MKKTLMKKVNKIIKESAVQSLYDYAWLVHSLMNVLQCEEYYAEARIVHNGFSLWELENRSN